MMRPLRSGPFVTLHGYRELSHIFSLFSRRFRFSFSHWLRLSIVLMTVCAYTLTSVTGFVAAYPALPVSAGQPHSLRTNSSSAQIANALRPDISASTPFDGLGDLSFYTYVTLPLNDRLELKVNVANGNLLVHSSDLSIHGRGVDLSIDSYYNSLTSYNYYMYEHGSNWTSNLCSTQYLDTHTNPNAGISFFGPSNFSAFFVRNSDGSYKDPPGLNATLKANGDSTYTLTYHKTGERVIFGADTSVEKIEDKNNNAISCSYENSSPKTTDSLTDTQGRKVSFSHDSNNHISQLSDPTGRTVGYGYDGNNNLTSITDLLNKRTGFGYNGHDLTSITDPLNHTTSISYLSGDKAGTITDATGNGTITFTYNNGNTVVKDQNGHSTTYTYNSSLQVTQTTDALGHNSTRKFDALNYNVTQYGDALSDFSNFVFSTDGRNNLSSIADGNGATTTFGYPTSGTNNLYYPLSQTDPQNNTTNYAYDNNGNLLSATDQKSGNKLTYTYNADGTPATGKDANNNSSSYGYDANGNLTSVTQPAPLGKITLTVDALSRVSSVTDGKNQKTTYSYDNLDRVTKITYNDSSTITYVYDDNSNLTSVTDNTGTTRFTYDVLNRITQKQLPDNSHINSTFDKVGNLTSYNDGTGTVNYAYNAVNRVTTLTEPDSAQTTYTYDNANRNTTIHYPNNTGMVMTYDAAGHELTSVGGVLNAQNQVTTTYSNFSYTYKTGSKQTSLLQTVSLLDPIGQSAMYHRQYSYDSQNRLTDAAIFNSSNTQVDDFHYGYDANSNLTSSNVWSQGPSVSYSYNNANELTSRTKGTTTTNYTYDANGNATSWSNGPSTSYNVKNQATSAGSDSYTYSGPTQSDRVTVNGNTFTYASLGLTKEVASSGTTDFVRNSDGQLLSDHTPDGKKYYYLFDGLGSVVGLTDSSGHDVNRYDYDPYGNMLHQQEQSGLNNPWKYASGYFDTATSLYKFGIRYYDSTTARWTQRTPVGGSLAETTKADPCVYADNNPTNEVDPNGSCPLCVVAAVGIIGGVYEGLSAANSGSSASGIAKASIAGFAGGAVGAAVGLAGAGPIVGAAIGGGVSFSVTRGLNSIWQG